MHSEIKTIVGFGLQNGEWRREPVLRMCRPVRESILIIDIWDCFVAIDMGQRGARFFGKYERGLATIMKRSGTV